MNIEHVEDCPVHGAGSAICCITIKNKEITVPEEKIRDHVKCSHEGCQSVFWRPQDASQSLSTIDLAQFHGWTILDREKGLQHCAWGH